MPEQVVQDTASNPATAAETQSAADQYDVVDEFPQLRAAAPEPEPVTEPTPQRARRADGTFLPASESPRPHSPAILRMAEDFGFSQAEIASLEPEALQVAVNTIARRLSAERVQNNQRANDINQALSAPPAQQPLVTAVSRENLQTPDEIDWGSDPDTGERFTEKSYAAPLANAVKNATKVTSLEARVAKLEALVQQFVTAEQQRQVEQHYSEVDMGFEACGPDYKSVFGEGRGKNMQASDPAFKRRVAVLTSLQADPPKGGSVKDNVKARALELFGRQQHAPPSPQPVNGNNRITPEQWEEATLARPTARRGAAEPHGPARAERAVAQQLAEMASDTGSAVSETTEEEFPG